MDEGLSNTTEDDDGSAFPSVECWRSFLLGLESDEYGVSTHRASFTRVEARQANGHVQGIAVHFDRGREGTDATIYLSLSDFPSGWGACLIERACGRLPHRPHPQPGGVVGQALDEAHQLPSPGMEAMAFPQGRHPGGINICDGVLAVPIEHDGRPGRVYLYDVGTSPLYPRQVGAFDSSIVGYQWPAIDGSDPTKASAAGIAHMGPDWTAPMNLPAGSDSEMLVVVLSEKRYLRFFRFVRRADGRYIADTETPTCDAMTEVEGWPTGWVDNISLVNLADGWRLVALSAEGLWPLINLQRRTKTTDKVTSFHLYFETNGDGTRAPKLTPCTSVEVKWQKKPETWPAGVEFPRRRPTEFFWPGFRWGGSVTWTGQEFALFTAEWFGDEEALVRPDADLFGRAPTGEAAAAAGGLMYVQFATNLRTEPFGYGRPDSHFGLHHAMSARRPLAVSQIAQAAASVPPLLAMGLTYGGKLLQGITLLFCTLLAFAVVLSIDGLTVRLLLFASGSIAGLVANGLIAVGVKDLLTEKGRKRRSWPWGLPFVAIGLVAVAATWWCFELERPAFTAGTATASLVGLGIGYNLTVRPLLDGLTRQLTGPVQRVTFWAVVITSLAAAARMTAGEAGERLALSLVLLTALVVVKFLAWSVVREAAGDQNTFSWRRLSRDPGPAGLVGSYGAALALVTTTAVARLQPSWMMLGWIALVTLAVWGAVEYQRPEPCRAYQNTLFWLGAGLLVPSFLFTWYAVPDLAVTLLVVAVATTVGIFVVWPGEAGLVLVAAAFLLSWAAIDTDAARPPEQLLGDVSADAPTRWVVALGDSFISGEGASAFYPGTNQPGVNVCRRAPSAWPELVGEHLAQLESDKDPGERAGVRVKSFACSGATIDQIATSAQHPEATADDFGGQVAQLDAFSTWLATLPDKDQIAYILISAGGNNAGFAQLIGACVVPRAKCDDHVAVDLFARRIVPIADDYRAMLAKLENTLGDNAHRPTIVVNPYVDPLGSAPGPRCGSFSRTGSLITPSEVDAIRSFRQQLNTQIERVVTDYLDSNGRLKVRFNAAGAQVVTNICGDSTRDPVGHKWLVLQPPDRAGTGPLPSLAALRPSALWVSGSGHPNETGHRATAATVCTLVTEREAGAPDSLPGCLPDGAAAPALTSNSYAQPATPTSESDTTGPATTREWLDNGTRHGAHWLALSLALGAFGGTLLGASAAHRRNRLD